MKEQGNGRNKVGKSKEEIKENVMMSEREREGEDGGRIKKGEGGKALR